MIDLDQGVRKIRESLDRERNAAPTFTLQRAADIHVTQIDWLWPGMLARGKVHVLAGRGGMGKTTLMLKVAATITNGDYFPDCRVPAEEGDVIYISAEDTASDTLIPRFLASGGEAERFHVMPDLMASDGQFLSILDHHRWLTDVVRDKSALLLIFDPVTAFCGTNMDNNSPTHVRSVVARLEQIVETTQVAVMCLTHLTKRRDGQQVDQVLGSGAWSHAPRIVWGVIDDDAKYLGLMKSNISDLEHVYPYSLHTVPIEAVEAQVARIGHGVRGVYLRDYTDVGEPQRGRKIIDVGQFLRDRLEGGPVEKKTLISELEEGGVSESTIQRAARELGVKSVRGKATHGPAMWSLPDWRTTAS